MFRQVIQDNSHCKTPEPENEENYNLNAAVESNLLLNVFKINHINYHEILRVPRILQTME